MAKDIQNLRAAKIATVISVHDAPQHSWPEVAFVGRSNVGKSSLLTMLTGLHNLAPVSKTPGRTKTIGLYALKNPELCLVDLPGYGFAQLSQELRKKISIMISDYIYQRPNLMGVILLVDARRAELSAEDKAMVEVVMSAQKALLVVLTKCDKIPKNQIGNAKLAIERSLKLPKGSVIATSTENGLGKKELWAQLTTLIQQAKQPAATQDDTE